MIEIDSLIRGNIRTLKRYSSARDEFSGEEGIFLDANENPFGTLNRYPDPYQRRLKEVIGMNKGIDPSSIFIGNGSDEVIDLLFRIFCEPGKDQALTFAPTYGMYEVSAAINDVELIKIELNDSFNIDLPSFLYYSGNPSLKLMLICSPNNPTGNSMNPEEIEQIIQLFKGIVLIDEAYIDFSEKPSFIRMIGLYPNLIISQTLSKARGLAAARIGIAYASQEIIELLNKVKPPYNVSSLNQQAAIAAFEDKSSFEKGRRMILAEKERLIVALEALPLVKRVFPSDANFLLVEVDNADLIYNQLVDQGIVVRNRNSIVRNCLRISIGTPDENELLIKTLRTF